MLLCGIIDELKEIADAAPAPGRCLLSYFFCQATEPRINSATAVLRGLIYLLADQQPALLQHVRKKYDASGKELFVDANAWFALSEIFTNISQDPRLERTYVIIDALDECVTDLQQLLQFIDKTSPISPRVKWIVSSRDWPKIEKGLSKATQKLSLKLELNEKYVSAAVTTYILFKVEELAVRNDYDIDARQHVQRYLSLNANGTFLWVALVCHAIINISGWEIRAKLPAFPPGLDALYERMMIQICESEDAERCKSILAVVSVVHRPITLDELLSFVDLPLQIDYKALREIIGLCGSFLTLQDRTISFVHQSAKDFIVKETSVFPAGMADTHHMIFSRSLRVLRNTLQRDVYSLRAPGITIDQVRQPDPDPLATVRYSCLYWVDHLLECQNREDTVNDLTDNGLVHSFLRQCFLYWLEALSLLKSMSEGVVVIRKLEDLLVRILCSLIFVRLS